MNHNGNSRNFLPALEHEFRRFSGEFRTAFARAKSVMIAAGVGGEGATTTVVNLARAMAENPEQRILLVDANFHDPALHFFFELDVAGGIRDWDGHAPLRYKPTGLFPNLFILTAGEGDPSAPGGIRPALLQQLARRVREAFDFVVWDVPPLARFPDGLTLAAAVDGVLLVVEADRTTVATLGLVCEQLKRADANLLGAVLNRSGRFLPRALRSRYDN